MVTCMINKKFSTTTNSGSCLNDNSIIAKQQPPINTTIETTLSNNEKTLHYSKSILNAHGDYIISNTMQKYNTTININCTVVQSLAEEQMSTKGTKTNDSTNVLSRRQQRQQPVLLSPIVLASLMKVALFLTLFTTNLCACVLAAESGQGNGETPTTTTTAGGMYGQQEQQQQQSKDFVDPSCKWTKEEAPSRAETILFIMKCDLNPLIRNFEQLMCALEPSGPKHLISLEDVENMRGVVMSGESKRTWFQIIAFSQTIEQFYNDSMSAINRKEFCTYPTIHRFKQLKTYILNGSKLLADLYDVIAIEYHTYCLEEALKKLPKIPDIVQQVVDIYVDGRNARLPDLNRPPGFHDEKKDEFKFDLVKAIEQNGPLEIVVDLVMDFGFSMTSSKEKIKKFKIECKKFLIDIEERWQSMEMMSKMLSTQLNAIEEFNNFLMRALIPTKYADVCSQLSEIS